MFLTGIICGMFDMLWDVLKEHILCVDVCHGVSCPEGTYILCLCVCWVRCPAETYILCLCVCWARCSEETYAWCSCVEDRRVGVVTRDVVGWKAGVWGCRNWIVKWWLEVAVTAGYWSHELAACAWTEYGPPVHAVHWPCWPVYCVTGVIRGFEPLGLTELTSWEELNEWGI